MTITSISGKSSMSKPGGVVLDGPAKTTGDARLVKWGSVKILIPSTCMRKEA